MLPGLALTALADPKRVSPVFAHRNYLFIVYYLSGEGRGEGCRKMSQEGRSATKTNGCREPGITETIITCKTGIRYTGIGHNGIRYIKTGIRYNAIGHNGIRYNRE